MAGYKKPLFKVFAYKDFLFKTGFEQMVLKHKDVLKDCKVSDILVQAQSKITLHAKLKACGTLIYVKR